MADERIIARLDRHDDQLARLAQLVGRLHAVAERHNEAIWALEVALARMVRGPWGAVPREERRP